MIQAEAEMLAGLSEVTPAMRAQVGAVAIVSTLALLPIAWLAVKRLVPGRNIVFARWGFSHVALALLVFVATQLVLGLVGRPGESLTGDLLLSSLSFAVLAAAIAVWAARLDPDGVLVLGLRARGVVRAVPAGLILYLATMPGIVGVMFLWSWVLEISGYTPAPQEVAQRFAALESSAYAVPLLLGIVVQPLLEEIVFRSFLQPLLVQNFREVAGVGLTSFVFAAMHAEPSVFLPLFLLSCLLGAVMLRTQSVYAVWAIHALNNGLMFALLALRPDLAGVGGGT